MNKNKESGGTLPLYPQKGAGSPASHRGQALSRSNGTSKPDRSGKRLNSEPPWWAIAGRYLLYGLAFLSTAAAVLVLILAASLKMMFSDSFPDLQSRLVTTFLETG